MADLDLTPPEKPKYSGIANMFVLGGSLAGGGSVVIGVLELVRQEPERAFRLLQLWGPWFFLALFVSWVVYKLWSRALDMLQGFFASIASSMDRQALAIEKLSDKDDRQVQEMQTLTALTAQRSEKTYAMMQSFHEDNQTIQRELAETQKRMAETLSRLETKFDARIAGEKSGT